MTKKMPAKAGRFSKKERISVVWAGVLRARVVARKVLAAKGQQQQKQKIGVGVQVCVCCRCDDRKQKNKQKILRAIHIFPLFTKILFFCQKRIFFFFAISFVFVKI